MVNRGVLAVAVALFGVAGLGGLYARLTAPTLTAPAASAPAATAVLANSPASVAREHIAPDAPTSPSSGNLESQRLETRRVLYETVDALLQSGELEKARKLLDEDQRLHGDDLAPEWRDLEQSYRIIADCLEDPSPRRRARARAFAAVSQATALKPRILSACQG